MDAYIEANSSKKKFLVPLVVLLLCGVAMTGAAYAYNSTVDGTGSISDVDYVTIDFYGDEYNDAKMAYAAAGALTFNTATKLVNNVKTTTYTADSSVVIMKVFVKVDKNAVEDADKLADKPTVTIDNYNGPAGVTLKVGDATAVTGGFEYAITASGAYTGTGAPATTPVTFQVHASIATA